jgi:hypothetical protein
MLTYIILQTGIPKPSSYTATTAAATTTDTRSKGQWERWEERICTITNSDAVASAIELVNSAAFLPTLQALLKLAAKPDASEHTQVIVRSDLHEHCSIYMYFGIYTKPVCEIADLCAYFSCILQELASLNTGYT